MHSIKWKVWLYLVTFATAILLLLWLFQIVFLQQFYQRMKSEAVERAADTIAQEYGSGDFESAIHSIAVQNDLDVRVIGQNLFVREDFSGGNVLDSFYNSKEILLFDIRLRQSKTSSYHALIQDLRTGRQTGYLTARLIWLEGDTENPVRIFVYASVAPVGSVSKILQSQFYMITMIVFGMAFVLSFAISWQISRPIAKLTRSAKKLAEGDYQSKFEGGGFAEVDQLADTLNYAAGEISKVDGLRKDLIANISHDLRTPLTMIKAYAEMIRDLSGDSPQKRNEHLAVIINETDRLTSLVAAILDMSKMESGNAQMVKKPYNLSESVQSVLRSYEPLVERDGYSFQVSVEPDLILSADEMRMEQVMHNLLSNAVTYTGEDKRVEVSLRREGAYARFEVQDTGEGITPENLEHIWDRYYKVKSEHKRAVTGTGLGLHIVKTILDAHGFSYGAQSEVGKGSVFWYLAPLYDGAADGMPVIIAELAEQIEHSESKP